jgi:hypothetical protein
MGLEIPEATGRVLVRSVGLVLETVAVFAVAAFVLAIAAGALWFAVTVVLAVAAALA